MQFKGLKDGTIYQGEFDGRGQQTASPMFIAIMSGGVGISGGELSLSC